MIPGGSREARPFKLARGMRLLAAAACFVPALAHAEPEPEVTTEEIDLERLEHEVSAGYDVSLTVAGDGGGAGIATASLGGDASYTASFGEERSEYEVTIDAAAAIRRLEGTVRANGATTRLHLGLGPAAMPVSNRDDARIAIFPTTFELDHAGELAALPTISTRPRVLRAPYLTQQFAAATRAVIIELADDGIDDRPGMEDLAPQDRSTGAIEVFPIQTSVEVTQQDGTRLDGRIGFGMLAMRFDFPMVGRADVFAGEHQAIELADGNTGSVDTVWAVRAVAQNAATGTDYELSFGVATVDSAAARERTRDHRGFSPMVGAFGGFSDHDRAAGFGVQYRHDLYLTMTGEPAIEDRGFVEGWWQPRVTRLSARVFAARTRHQLELAPATVWTGGVELDARREIGKLAVGLHAEGGQSYYATLDGGAPDPGFGARAALTLSRSARWVRGTR